MLVKPELEAFWVFVCLFVLFQSERFFCPSTEWRPGSTGQILSDLDVTSQKEGRWRHLNTLAHYNVSITPYCQVRDL